MKAGRFLAFLGLLILSKTGTAQAEVVTPAKTFVCAYAPMQGSSYNVCLQAQTMGFRMNDRGVQAILGRILSPIGLQPNFRMVPCDSINNCIAYTAPSGYRYVLFDPEFLGGMADETRTNWVYYSIFAHEIAHHLNQHLYQEKTLAEERQMELEADEWSGNILALMGASMADAQAGILSMPDQDPKLEAYSSHPTKSKRLAAIRRGYEKGSTFKMADRVEKTVVGEQLVNHRLVKAKALPGLQNLWDKQFYLQQVVYDNKEWQLFLRRSDKDYEEGFYISDTLPYSQLSQYSFTNWNISALEYLGKSWFVGLSKSKRTTEQEVMFGPINVKQISGTNLLTDSAAKALTDFGSDGKNWVALFDDPKSIGCTDQEMLADANFPEEKIMARQEEGFKIARIKYISKTWYVLLNKYSDKVKKTRQVIFSGDEGFPWNKMENYDNSDYYLQTAGTDGKKWIVVMSKVLMN